MKITKKEAVQLFVELGYPEDLTSSMSDEKLTRRLNQVHIQIPRECEMQTPIGIKLLALIHQIRKRGIRIELSK